MTPKASSQAQPSISSFFKRKTPPSSPVKPKSNGTQQGNGHSDVVDLTSPPPEKRPKVSGADARRAALSQPSSSYFGNPKAASNNAALSSSRSTSALASARRAVTPRAALASYALPRAIPSQVSSSGAAFDSFATQLCTPVAPRKEQTEEQKRRQDAWTQRINSGGLIRRRRSLALDEAEAAEARREAGAEKDDDDEQRDSGVIEFDSDEERSKKKAEGVGSKLAAKYAAKGDKGTKGKGKKKEEIGPSGMTYTPLEKQYMEIKRDNPDALLLMEVGYKFKWASKRSPIVVAHPRFHGDDAKIASKELGIVAFPNRNFYTASIPVYRMNIHVKKLISLGYKVGVITQTETAALKKIGENRNAPFTRELTHLFTAATYVEDPASASSSNLLDDPVVPGSAPPPTNALVAIVEMGLGGLTTDDRVRIGLVSVVPPTGEVVWDEFDDSQVRSELETRLTHLAPAELLLPAQGLSKATEKVLGHFAGEAKSGTEYAVRVERIGKIASYSSAFDYLTKFYNAKDGRPNLSETNSNEIDMTGESDTGEEVVPDEDVPMTASQAEREAGPMELAAGLPAQEAILALVDFPKQIVVALCVAVKYMKTFKLENAFRHRSSFTKFINRAHMLLSSNTLINLEVYRNQTDGGVYGSLLWLLDHTRTRMGRRLMREWIGRPLLDVIALQARVDAIDEIMNTNTYYMEKLRSLLVNMPDLVRGLTRIQYGKATPSEVASILVSLNRIGTEFKPDVGTPFTSSLLNNIIQTLPTIREAIQGFLQDINVKIARDNDEANWWTNPDKYPAIQDAKDCISICDSELDQHLKEVRKIVKRPTLNYVTVAGIEFLVEVPTRDAKTVPPKWVKISSTKSAVRYHTPEILRITKEREQHKETLAAAARRALLSFQTDISECHQLVIVARQIAVIDCLMSLAQVALASGYCKPKFVAEPCLHVRDGRHPMVEMLRDEAYVPFDIDFSEKEGTAKVITGPNMAGKSSCVRAAALIVCMAQIGSFVPASSVTLGVHDAVQTRMGASDDIGRGKSTFMVELSETSDILRTLTPRTLVILDELGRGTSTYDGVAIAYATLSHVAARGCNTLFVTHYPQVAEELAKEYPEQISNWHMSFDEVKSPDGNAEITFLYKLTRGLAEASFGVWCARLAGLPKDVLQTAQLRADQLKYETDQRRRLALASRTQHMLNDLDDHDTTTASTTNATTRANALLKNANALHRALQLYVK